MVWPQLMGNAVSCTQIAVGCPQQYSDCLNASLGAQAARQWLFDTKGVIQAVSVHSTVKHTWYATVPGTPAYVCTKCCLSTARSAAAALSLSTPAATSLSIS